MLDMLNQILPAIISIVGFIIFIVVLIKSFKAGVLKGILGIITCGLFTFIWGWIKHKELQLTKLMLLWTVLMILSIAVPIMTGGAQVMKIIPMLKEQTLNLKGKQKAKFTKPKKTNKVANKKAPAAGKKKKSAEAKANQADWNSRAVALWKNGKYTNPNQAIQYLDKAIQKNADFAEAYNNRGNAYRDLNQLQKAFQDYNQALRLNPNYIQAYNNRGNIYYDLKKYQLAVNDYTKSLNLNPAYLLAYLNRGLAYHQLKQDNLACQDLQKACQMGDCEGLNWAKQKGFCK